jgi:hypothetical protein
MVLANNEINRNKKYTSNAGDFDCHADAAVQCRAQMKHIPGFTRRQCMLSLGEYPCPIAPTAAMVDKFVETTQNTNKTQLLPSNSTFQSLVVYQNCVAHQIGPSTQLIDATSFV